MLFDVLTISQILTGIQNKRYFWITSAKCQLTISRNYNNSNIAKYLQELHEVLDPVGVLPNLPPLQAF